MASYKTFTKPSQVRKAISNAKEKEDDIALRKLRKIEDYKFKKIKKVQLYY